MKTPLNPLKSLVAVLLCGATVLTPGVNNARAESSSSLTASDAIGTSSFNTAGHWSGGSAPGPGVNFYTAGFQLRTPGSGTPYTFAGDSLTVTPNPGSSAINLKLGSPGVITINNCTNAGGIIASGNGSTTYTVSGSMVVIANTAFGVQNDTTRTLILSNLVLTGSGVIITNGSSGNGLGNIIYAGNATGFTGSLVVDNGTVFEAYSQTNLFGNPSSFNPAQLLLNWGTFTPLASLTLNNPNSGVTIAPGGGTFNIGSGLTLTNNTPLAGSGALTNSGVGRLILNGSGTSFTGSTYINSGTVAIGASGSLPGSPNINVASGATFDVSAAGFTLASGQNLYGAGTINGNLTDASGSTINAGGVATVGNLTFNNNLTLVNGGNIVVDINSTTNDVITVNGNLSPSGTTYVSIGNAPPGGFVNGTSYTIMKVNGTLGGTAANFAVPATLQTRQTFPITYDTVNKLVKLTVAGTPPANLVWQGDFVNGSANAWDIDTTTNWLNGGNPDYYFDLDAVNFTDDGTNQYGTINQPTLDVTVNPKSVTFNATNNYTLSSPTGLGVIAGAGTLTKTNTGSVSIQTTNTYSGGTLVFGGVLQSAAAGALGNPSGSVLVAVTNAASFDFDGNSVSSPLKVVLISGSGVAGNQGSVFTSRGMGCPIGCTAVGIKSLRLSGNATLGDDYATWQIGLDGSANGAAPGSIDGKGFSLTKVGNNTLVLENTNASALSQFVLANGSIIIANTGGNPFGTSATLVISNGAYADSWDNYANSGITLANPITIGLGGGTLQNTHGMYYNHACYNTYSGNVTLSPDTNVNNGLTILDTSYFGGAPNNVPTWGTMTFSGAISGTNNVAVVGPLSPYSGVNNPVNFTGNNTYSGLTIVSNFVTLNTTTYNQGGGAYDIVDFGDLDVIPVSGRPTLYVSSLLLDVQLLGPPSIGFSRLTSMPTSPLIYATNISITSSCDIVPPKTGYSIGQFPLIKYQGSIGGTGFAGLTMNTLPRGVAAYLSNNIANSSIDLVVSSLGIEWTGANSSSWDIASTENWWNPQYLTPDYYYDGDTVVFNDFTNNINYNVQIPANVMPTGITVNTTNTYSFGGPFGITGAASLLKTGPGMLIIANSNNVFTGGTTINQGTLQLADDNYAYPYPGGALNDNLGVVTVNSGGTLDVNGVQVPNYQSYGPDGYNVYISGAGVTNGGALVNNNINNNDNADAGYVTLTGNATVGGLGDVNVRHGAAPKLSSQSGAYTLTKVGPGNFRVRYLTEVSTNFGNINILQGNVSFETSSTNGFGDPTKTIWVGSGAGFILGTASAPFKKQMVCSNGSTIYGYNTTGNVFASPIALDSGTITLNANYFNALTFSNVLSGAGGISVTYNSTVTFATNNTYTGNTYVSDCNASPGSILRLAGNGSISNSPNITLQGVISGEAYAGALDASGRTDGTLTLANGQTLRGDNGSYVKGNVVASSGTTITPGGLGNVQSMNFSNNLTLQAGSVFVADVAYDGVALTSNDVANVTGTLTYGGALNVNAMGAPLVAGNSFKLFNAGTVSGSFASTNLPALGTGLGWNWNPATATLSVVATVNTNAATANFQAALTSGGSALHFTWAPDHQGWQLYTNSVGLNAISSWFPITGSSNVTNETITINPANAKVFFQLRYP